MSKKTNTLWFLLGATVFNILVTIASFVVLLVLYGRLIAPVLPQSAAAWGLPVVFILAIALAFVAYRYALKLFMKKVDVDKHFDPLVRSRGPQRRD